MVPCAVNLSSVGVGAAIGWTAQALAVLRGERPGSPLRLSLDQASWASALVPLGALAGALPAGYLADAVGRKRALLGETAPMIAGWLLILFAGDAVWLLYLGRVLTGLGVGANAVLVSIYCEEIAQVRVRGKLGSYLDVLVCVGMLLVYVTGALLPYFWYTLVSLLPPVAFLLTFCWMPESPAFLVARGRVEDARLALAWLRGPDADIGPELRDLQNLMKRPSDGPRRVSCLCCSFPRVDRVDLKALAIVFGLMFFTQATGVNIFIFYITDVFKEAGTDLSPRMATVVIGAVHLVGTAFPTLTVDRLGRRLILGVAGLVNGLCLVVMSVYSFLDVEGYDLDAWRWVPLAALVIFMFMISAGPGPLCWFMMAELLPMSIKGWGSALAVAFSRLCVVLLVKEFPPMALALGLDVTYAIFAVQSFLGIAFTMWCVPETKGKTKEEIQRELRGEKRNVERTNEDC
ncbi:hypothetical protein R5R35_009469 [Gryllus longicercus]|uniref:Major facilitator superfamily (MFS) profile domain-containing protein n=1 Tax=Gryllus longicercus TaxID=2509291 RepID=A0AAN9VY56_9ORTH